MIFLNTFKSVVYSGKMSSIKVLFVSSNHVWLVYFFFKRYSTLLPVLISGDPLKTVLLTLDLGIITYSPAHRRAVRSKMTHASGFPCI